MELPNLNDKAKLLGGLSGLYVVLDPKNLTVLFDPITEKPWTSPTFSMAQIRAEDASALTGRKCIPVKADEAARHITKGLQDLAAKYGKLSLADLNRIAQGKPPLERKKR